MCVSGPQGARPSAEVRRRAPPHRLESKMRNVMASFIPALLGSIVLCAAAQPAQGAGKLVVGHDSWIGYSGVFIAESKGFFKEAGLDVELKRFPGPGDSPPALIAGHLDLTLTTLHNLVLIAGNSPETGLKLVYLIDSSNGADGIVSKKDIATVAGLKGKKVAVTVGEANEFLLIAALEKAGLAAGDVQAVNVSADDAGAA